MSNAILIVDDEKAICASLAFALEDRFRVFTAGSGDAALACLKEHDVDIVLLDVVLGEENGLRVLERIRAGNAEAVVIMMTAFGSIRSSVDAIKNGAFHYLTKPIDMGELNAILSNALELLDMRARVRYLNQRLQAHEFSGMIGQSARMAQVTKDIERVGGVESSVLIVGESGTGKELVARAIHRASPRRNEAFEALNCAAIPSELLESELFGHEKGAFTGAVQRKKGIFELAHRGTLFLDEVAEIDIKLQAKLLRAVQEKEIMPLGLGQRRKVDVRIVSATNRDLKKMLAAGTFREDLYFRLNVVSIAIPPLRERREDIPLLVAHFLEKYNRKMGRQIRAVAPEALDVLMRYDFRGNVRELENIIERAIVFSDGNTLLSDSLPAEVFVRQGGEAPPDAGAGMVPIRVGEDLAGVERKLILATLRHCRGDKAATARSLGISERKLWYKLKEYQQSPEPPANIA